MELLGAAHLQSEGEVGQMRQMCSLHGFCLVARTRAQSSTHRRRLLQAFAPFSPEVFSSIGGDFFPRSLKRSVASEHRRHLQTPVQQHSAKLRQI